MYLVPVGAVFKKVARIDMNKKSTNEKKFGFTAFLPETADLKLIVFLETAYLNMIY